MPRQNRVTPFGDVIATPERGTLMGNRGVLHDGGGHLRRAWQLKRWLLCLLEFKGRTRSVLTPGRYTELFFLDEATGLAAGHRPCAECRRDRFNAFRRALVAGGAAAGGVTAGGIDERLHAERLSPDGSKRTFLARLDDLPDGVFVRPEGAAGACLLWRGNLLAWSPSAYRAAELRPGGGRVAVLTPPSVVAAIGAGYVPLVHESAGRPWGGYRR
jgi:hypothetical protein